MTENDEPTFRPTVAAAVRVYETPEGKEHVQTIHTASLEEARLYLVPQDEGRYTSGLKLVRAFMAA